MRYWVENNTYPPKELAARFHNRLVYIHLFPSGNGRHAQIMTDTILTKLLKQPAIDWAGGFKPENMDQRRIKYVAALKAADQYDFTALLDFVDA
ncbi:MAG: Fic family protein [Pseudomonadota bacterium]